MPCRVYDSVTYGRSAGRCPPRGVRRRQEERGDWIPYLTLLKAIKQAAPLKLL